MKKVLTICLFIAAWFTAGAQDFFSPTTYRGAFGSNDWTADWTNWNPRNTSYPTATVTVQGNITSNTTWTADKTYLLKGYVYVKNNATLTIEPGTVIRCDVITSTTLVITRGAKIVANGTALQPVIFTSNESAGSRSYGDWGGLVILGKGRINASGGSADVGAGINNAQGDGIFGGTDDNDSSGSLNYVRIEFAGIQYQPDKEIPGLCLSGVGARTVIDNIQVSYCGNDGVHLAGGTARISHLVIHRGFDSDITMDLGYRGLLQFGIILRDSTKASANGTSGIEIQNDGLASSAEPFTDPTISNFTILGPMTVPSTPFNSGYRNGIHFRRNGRGAVFNTAIAGYPRGVMMDGQGCGSQLKSGNIIVQNCILAGNKIKQLDTAGNLTATYPGCSISDWYNTGSFQNTLFSVPRDLKMVNPYNYNSPTFIPISGSSLLTGASFVHPRLNDTEIGVKTPGTKLPITWCRNENTVTAICTAAAIENLEFRLYNLSGKLYGISQSQGSETRIELPVAYGMYIIGVYRQDGTYLGYWKLTIP